MTLFSYLLTGEEYEPEDTVGPLVPLLSILLPMEDREDTRLFSTNGAFHVRLFYRNGSSQSETLSITGEIFNEVRRRGFIEEAQDSRGGWKLSAEGRTAVRHRLGLSTST